MLLVPQECCTRVISNAGIVGTANPWTQVTSSGSANTYGSVVELISAANNTQDSWGIEVIIVSTGASTVSSETCVDILAGAATEDKIIDSLIGGFAYAGTSMRYFFPLYIPAGTRISAQAASAVTSNAVRVGVYLYGNGNPPFRVGGRVTTYGTKVNSARGQAVTPAASGGTASVTEMTASSSRDHFYFLPGFQVEADGSIAAAGWVNVGIGVGAATEERIGTWFYPKATTEQMSGPMPMFGAFRDVPSGTRLSLLVSNATTNDAAYGGLIYAVG
jgi:hypothetical protein